MHTKLKIIIEDGLVHSDDRHEYGGIDLFQRRLFTHLTDGRVFIDEFELRFLIDMAEAHGWEVVVSEKSKKS